jgi:cytochrome c oxidase assembly protein subunit 15
MLGSGNSAVLTDPDMRGRLVVWLLVCTLIVLGVVVVGGYTRLTHSGLSIVEWQPIVGTILPIGPEQWEAAFARYRETPEYQKVNAGMSLAAFKEIYWVEWIHRLLGRLSGAVFGLPLLYWLARRRVSRRLAVRLTAFLVLGGLQGALGWYMVASGLVDIPRVSPYRLTAHLGLATVLLAGLWWTALDLMSPTPPAHGTPPGVRRAATAIVGLAFVTILSGGFVAGTRAGFAFNTFPLMAGQLVPDGLYAGRPLYESLFEHIPSVQFHHRLLATTLAAASVALWWRARRTDVSYPALIATRLLAGVVAVQATLGVATLLYVVPVPLATAHQGWAMVVLLTALLARHRMRRVAI